MLFRIYSIIKKKINLIFCIVVITALLIVSGTFTYSRYTYHYETTFTVTVSASDKCEAYGIETLSECAIFMDNTSKTVEDAKEYIEKKTYDTSTIEPTVVYLSKTGTTSSSSQTDSKLYYFFILDSSDNPKNYFSTSTGYYNFESCDNYVLMSMRDYYNLYLAGVDLSNYYTGWQLGIAEDTTMVFQITDIISTSSVSSGITTYYYSANVYGNSIDSTSSSSPGLYATEDYDGETTYFYRGEVTNNYVLFAGYIWRIVRINGDGSVRMIYSGTSTSATGSETSIGTATYNTSYDDTTYVGYTYGENFTLIDEDTTTSTVTYIKILSTTSYYFSDAYECTEEGGTYSCSLTGNLIQGTWSSVYSDAISTYKYTCFSTDKEETCTKIGKVTKYNSATSATIIWLGWSSKELSDTYGETDSTIKEKIDSWYKENIEEKQDDDNHSYAEYVVDEVFCNDRSTYITNISTGATSWHSYPLTTLTYYSPYNRLYLNNSPSLTCTNQEDRYMQDDQTGNGILTYPVGLITADEVALAGGVASLTNYKYYLYTGQTYWTLSPSHFHTSYGAARVWSVYSTGYLAYGSGVNNKYGVRPVINLSANIYVTKGTGTADNPFQVSLTKS